MIKTGKNIISIGIISLMLMISYSSLLFNCTKNTDAYVSYFQEELHKAKDYQRKIMFDN